MPTFPQRRFQVYLPSDPWEPSLSDHRGDGPCLWDCCFMGKKAKAIFTLSSPGSLCSQPATIMRDSSSFFCSFNNFFFSYFLLSCFHLLWPWSGWTYLLLNRSPTSNILEKHCQILFGPLGNTKAGSIPALEGNFSKIHFPFVSLQCLILLPLSHRTVLLSQALSPCPTPSLYLCLPFTTIPFLFRIKYLLFLKQAFVLPSPPYHSQHTHKAASQPWLK